MRLAGDVPQKKRLSTLNKFKTGELKYLIATDVAGRGIHDRRRCPRDQHYELPDDAEAYVHRIGRTGRAGASGTCGSASSLRTMPSTLPALEEYLEREHQVHPQALRDLAAGELSSRGQRLGQHCDATGDCKPPWFSTTPAPDVERNLGTLETLSISGGQRRRATPSPGQKPSPYWASARRQKRNLWSRRTRGSGPDSQDLNAAGRLQRSSIVICCWAVFTRLCPATLTACYNTSVYWLSRLAKSPQRTARFICLM